MYSSVETDGIQPSGLRRLARRDLPSTPRTPRLATNPIGGGHVVAPMTDAAIAWPDLSVANALSWLRRGALWIAILAVLGAIAGYGYASLAKPRYTAYTDLVIDPANLQLVTNDLYATSYDQNAQLLDVESKLRVLTSGNVLTRVVRDLNLQDDPEFVAPVSGLPFLGGAPEVSDPVLAAVGALEKKVTARREERSFVVTLGVSTEEAQKSARIATGIVDAFQTELAKAEADGATRAAASLFDRLGELKAGVTAAEDAVATFRRQYSLEETATGELVNTQILTETNARLVEARQALISVEARYNELIDPQSGKLNADSIQTPTMVALRTQYGLIRQDADRAAAVYGPLHPNRGSGERQLAGLQAQIDAEAARYVQATRLDLVQAQGTVAQLEAQAAAARETVATDGSALVKLRDLERDAKAKSEVYEAFLQRTGEITERQQLDTTNIRIISPATPPGARSWPPRAYVVAGGGAFGGLAIGMAVALGLGFLAAARHLRKDAAEA